jgi:hypothetical protein
MKGIGVSPNSKVIFMDSSVDKTNNLMQQLMASFEASTVNDNQKK